MNDDAEQTDKIIHFQAITNIDSIEECRHILEAHNWNIELAVQSTFNDQFNDQAIDTGGNDIQRPMMPDVNPVRNATTTTTTPPPSPNANSHTLPTINILTQRSLSYYNQPVAPRGLFQWTFFLISIPIRFVYTTLADIFGFFLRFINKNPQADAIQQNYDPLANVVEFIVDFNQKYGADSHPNFFEGSYGQAVNEAKRSFKFLLVYIHDHENQDCHKFATETLNNREVIDYLNNSVLMWACSKQLPEGKKVHSALKSRRCPFIGLIVLRANKMTLVSRPAWLLSRIEGPIKPAELLIQLSNILNDYHDDLALARIEREGYNETQRLREQQDQAYAECLRQDQEKAKKQRELDLAKKRQEEEEQKRIEDEKRKLENALSLKIELKKQLPKEPEPTDVNTIKLLLKMPSGRRLERLFTKTDPAKHLYNFLFCDDECPLNFEIVTNFPRKKIECSHDTECALAECGINQSMLLFVNDLDA